MAACVAATGLAFTLSACSSENVSQPRAHSVLAKSADEIVVASYPALDEGIKIAIERYRKVRPDIKVRLSSLSFGDHHNSLTTGLATGVSLPDIVAIEVGFLGRLIESAALEDLSQPPYNALQFRDRVFPFTITQASRRGGGLVAMPVDIGPGTLLYRKDIIDQAGVTEAQLTQSWESFIGAGKQIKAKTGSVLVPNASSLSDLYIRATVQTGEGIYFDANNKPLVTTPRFERAFELAKAVRAAGLDGKFVPWSTEWFEGFKRGSFATEMTGAWLAGHLANYIAPQSKGLWRAARLPSGVYAAWGGSYYGVPKRLPEARKLAAWEFIRFLALDRDMQLAALKGLDAYPSLVEASNDPFFEEPVEYLGGQQARVLWRNAAQHIPAPEVNRLDPIAAQVIAAELEKVLELDKPIKDALATAKRVIERRVRR
jgi:multiple sugar transport system substrate-binding protein